eukprot:COSAG03_NODE_4361_length_1575_cov_40.602304_2_plen_92_part_00
MLYSGVRYGLHEYKTRLRRLTNDKVTIDGEAASLLYEALCLPLDKRPEDINPAAVDPRDTVTKPDLFTVSKPSSATTTEWLGNPDAASESR